MTSGRTFAAAIFDLNGTLVDDLTFHFRAWRELGARLGKQLDDAFLQSINGLKNEDILPRIAGRPLDVAALEALAREKEERYRALYGPVLAPVAGASELLGRLRRDGWRLALASSAPPENRRLVLDGLGWRTHFDAIVASEGLPGKPSPDVFLVAARELGVTPAKCIAFEDAVNGVRSAAAAGTFVVGLTTTVSGDELRAAGARLTVGDFTELPDDLGSLA